MSSRNMRAFFNYALNRSTVELDIQKQAYRYAVRTKDNNLLVQLARHSNLATEVEEQIKTSQDLDVLSAWATRPDQDVDAVIKRFRAEKRVTLLTSLAGKEGLPEELYRSLAERDAVSLNWQLLKNSSVPKELRITIAGSLGRSCTRTDRRIFSEFEQVTRAGAEFELPFVKASSNPAMLRMVARDKAESNAELSCAAIDRLLEFPTDGDMARAVAFLAQQVDARGVLQHIADSLPKILLGRENDTSPATQYLREAFTRATARSAVDIDEVLAPISSASSAVDIRQEISKAQNTLRQLGYWVGKDQYARIVLDNPNIDPGLLSDYWTMASQGQLRAIADRAVAEKDRDMAVTVMGYGSQYQGYGDMVSEYAEKAPDTDEFLAWLIGPDTSAPRIVQNARVVRDDAERAMRLLPVTDVLSRVEAQKLILETLGDHGPSWDTFATLADEWSGALPDLLAAVKNFTTAS